MRAPSLVDRHSAGALVLALAIPFLFVHERYQPSFELDYGSTSFEIRLSDFAVALVLLAALVSATRYGSRRLGPARLLWVPGALLLVWLALQTFRPASVDDTQFDEHFVSYLKFVEYALLTLAVPLLIRRARDLTIFFGVVVLWCALATAVALAQFFGLDVFDAWDAGRRQPSFLGHHDLAALCAIATGLAAAGIVATRRRIPAASLFAVALVAGTLGMLVAASLAAALGFAVGAVALALASRSRFSPSRRQVLALFALVVVIAGGTTAIRADSLEEFVRFIGIRDEPTDDVETYSQRTVLAYIGLRIFQDNPVIGVGWQRSSREEVFTPYLADARERFPNVAEEAFPAPGREWGVQNLYIQMLADAGLVGILLLIAVGLAGIILAWRTARHAPSPWGAGAGLAVICVLLTLAGEWASLGIVAGIPLDAATCLFLGLAAAGAATTEEETFS